MSNVAKLYIAGMITLGAAAVARGAYLWNPLDLTRCLWYLVLAVPAATLKVSLPGITGTMSVFFVFLLAGIAELSVSETLLIGSVCVIVQSVWRPRVPPRVFHFMFGVANISIAITAADLVYHLPLLDGRGIQSPFLLTLAASMFFVMNTFPIAVVVSLTEDKTLTEVWTKFYAWSFPYYLVGAAIVGVFSFANRMLDWQAWLLILPVVYVIYRSYHLYLGRLDFERREAEKQRHHAEEVAGLHKRAVDGLNAAIEANAKLDAVIRSSPLAILCVDGEQRMVTSWNEMAEQIFGWNAREILGHRIAFGCGPSQEIVEAAIDQSLCGDLVSNLEVTHCRKDGSSFDAAMWTAPLRDRGGRISGALVTIADVSDRKHLEQQLRLSQKMEAVGRLAGGIAHDFNNLLTVINGYSAMLAESPQSSAYARNQAKEILEAGNRAADLVSRLLAFSRRQIIKRKPLEVNELVRNLERMLRRLIGEHIELRISLSPRAGRILADLNQMEAVLMNLASNARDAMPGGGVLTIETDRVNIVDEEESESGGVPPGSYVRLIVRDTGEGMDARTKQHLFEPFFTTKPQGKGTGLGLASVYGGVHQNGGRVLVSSEVGEGTSFQIYLPCLRDHTKTDEAELATEGLLFGTERILLVEDEVSLRRMLREALSHGGYRVWEACNGADAIEQWDARVGAFDLLITDVVMPVMNGLKLAEELQRRTPSLKVIFMSGHSDDLISKQGLHSSMDFLAKPFVPGTLVKKVRDVLDEATSDVQHSLSR